MMRFWLKNFSIIFDIMRRKNLEKKEGEKVLKVYSENLQNRKGI